MGRRPWPYRNGCLVNEAFPVIFKFLTCKSLTPAIEPPHNLHDRLLILIIHWWESNWGFALTGSHKGPARRKGASIYDVHTIFGIFWPPRTLSTKSILFVCKLSAFLDPLPSPLLPPSVRSSYMEAPKAIDRFVDHLNAIDLQPEIMMRNGEG